MARFDTVVFDLDGTLLDTLPDLVILTNRALDDFGLPLRTSEEIRSFVGNGVRSLIHKAVPQGTPTGQIEAVVQRWKNLYPVTGNTLTKPYPYVQQTLRELKRRGISLGVLSNKFDRGVHDVIDEYLPDFFTVVHGECEQIPRKPNPTGLLRTVKELGSTPEKTLYVGDSPEDANAAYNAAVFSLGVTWGYHKAEDLYRARADAVIDDVRDLLKFI